VFCVLNVASFYTISICCFSAKHAAIRIESKYWLARNQDNDKQNKITARIQTKQKHSTNTNKTKTQHKYKQNKNTARIQKKQKHSMNTNNTKTQHENKKT
jgi:hypothetical protein